MSYFHPLAKLYKYVGEYYNEQREICDRENKPMPSFHFHLLNKRKALDKGWKNKEGIHDHRILLPTLEGMKQFGSVIDYFFTLNLVYY